MSDPYTSNTMATIGSYQGPGGNTPFPEPFLDYASLTIPTSVWQLLRYAEFIFNANGTYRQALDRVLSYFITDVEASGERLGDEEKANREEYLEDKLHIKQILKSGGLNYMCYGNNFLSVLMKFHRYLKCPKCGNQHPFRIVADVPDFRFRWSGYQFVAYCPRCQYDGDWGKPIDRKGGPDDIYVKHWNPHEIEILHDPYTDDASYIWKIPTDYKRMIGEGKTYYLERANWDVIQAIKNSSYFRFDDDVIFHLKAPSLAGLYTRGWGIPPSITNFRQIYYVQILNRFNEALALDYITPFRVLTPPSGAGGADPAAKDPIINMNLAGFVSRVNAMLKKRKHDPATWNVLPFPLQYQALGGDAKNLAPTELLNQGLEVMLNAAGVPVELYKGTLQLQSAPTALRLFESSWTHLVSNFHRTLAHIADRLVLLLSWEPTQLHLKKVTYADDVEARALKLQLSAGQAISQGSALDPLGLSFRNEQRKRMQEQTYTTELQAEFQEKMDKKVTMQQMQQPPPPPGQPQPGDPNAQAAGGQPAQGGPPLADASQQALAGMQINPNEPISLDDLSGRAQSIAQQLQLLPETTRKQRLSDLRRSQPTLHLLVRSQLDMLRSEMRRQGYAMMSSQAQQGGQQ